MRDSGEIKTPTEAAKKLAARAKNQSFQSAVGRLRRKIASAWQETV